MLPRSTHTRSGRNPGGRGQEIQRLIGRALRAAVDTRALGQRQVTVDCDVIQADGGTRTAAITGGWVALALAARPLGAAGKINKDPVQVVAPRNRGKVVGCGDLLGGAGALELVTIDDVAPAAFLREDEDTFEGNALAKARQAAAATGLPAIADDSGLEVDALAGAPGVWSARYAGEPSDDGRNNAKLLEALRGVPAEQRQARVRCAAPFVARARALVILAI